MSKIYDVSPLISPRLAVWPGDTAPSRDVLCDLARGDTVTLSTLRATVHLGTHADAPSHYALKGRTIEHQPLDRYLGPAQLIDCPVANNSRVTPAELRDTPNRPRVILRTGTYPDPTNFNQDFAGLSVELIEFLASSGVITIAVDTPSVDLFSSKDLPAHHACFRHDLAIIEGLVLEGVPTGHYELIALPLKLEGFDASPVRAILRRED